MDPSLLPLQLQDSPSAPGSFTLEFSPGLLELAGPNTSASVDGVYVDVHHSNSLILTSFTIEAFVFPEWDPGGIGLFRTVITLSTVAFAPNKEAFGFGIFSGPDPGDPTRHNVWQVWLGDGTEWKPVKDKDARSPTPVDFTKINYLAVAYDGSTLNMLVYTKGVDHNTDLTHPIKDTIVAYRPVIVQSQSLLIRMHRPPVGTALPVYHPFKGRIQEIAVYNKALTIGRGTSHILASMHL